MKYVVAEAKQRFVLAAKRRVREEVRRLRCDVACGRCSVRRTARTNAATRRAKPSPREAETPQGEALEVRRVTSPKKAAERQPQSGNATRQRDVREQLPARLRYRSRVSWYPRREQQYCCSTGMPAN